MSTRANILVTDQYSKQWFYKHSDGYPDGVMPILDLLLTWVREGKIRNNVSQAAGWLIIIGAIEYNTIPKFDLTDEDFLHKRYGKLDTVEAPSYWKSGSIEITDAQHGDVEYVYTVDLVKMTVDIQPV